MIEFNLEEVMKSKRWRIREIFKETGIAESTISRIRKQKSKGIDLVTLDTLCTLLDCNITDILKRKVNNTIPPEENNK